MYSKGFFPSVRQKSSLCGKGLKAFHALPSPLLYRIAALLCRLTKQILHDPQGEMFRRHRVQKKERKSAGKPSFFPFYHNVFHYFEDNLTVYKTTNFKTGPKRADNKINVEQNKKEILFGMGGKHCGKMRKCWLTAVSPFSTVFTKCFFFRVVNIQDCVVKI